MTDVAEKDIFGQVRRARNRSVMLLVLAAMGRFSGEYYERSLGNSDTFFGGSMDVVSIVLIAMSLLGLVRQIMGVKRGVYIVLTIAFLFSLIPEFHNAFDYSPMVRALPIIGESNPVAGKIRSLMMLVSILLLVGTFYMILLELLRSRLVLEREIAERERLETERIRMLERVQNAKKFESLAITAGSIAHNFNNILAGALGNTELAAMHLDDPEKAEKNLDAVTASIRRARDLTHQMLALSGGNMFNIGPLNVSSMLDMSRERLLEAAGESNALSLELAKDPPVVRGDGKQILQAVCNLVANAAEALKDTQGKIVIQTGVLNADKAYLDKAYLSLNMPAGPYVFIKVSDNGPGIPKEVLQRIFDPFFTTGFIGRGLGLPVTLGIVNAHKGNIRVDSEPEAGATFTILLPLSSAS